MLGIFGTLLVLSIVQGIASSPSFHRELPSGRAGTIEAFTHTRIGEDGRYTLARGAVRGEAWRLAVGPSFPPQGTEHEICLLLEGDRNPSNISDICGIRSGDAVWPPEVVTVGRSDLPPDALLIYGVTAPGTASFELRSAGRNPVLGVTAPLPEELGVEGTLLALAVSTNELGRPELIARRGSGEVVARTRITWDWDAGS
ncbi:MAG TPA: hypothetical protein VEA19_05725 [Actinomycetota bacterium]|nr:hypothetical protein [Actinomycetota bacterium]